jgi:RNA polymerase sigma-70 factor (ECF subfamily)
MPDVGHRPLAGDELLVAVHGVHAAALQRYVRHLTSDEEQTQDVVQETLLRAWRHPEVLERSEDSVRAWLFTVARHLVVDQYRSARHVHERSTDVVPDRPEPDRTQEVLDQWLVGDALAGLSAEHRAVVVGAYYGGRSVTELADELEIPAGTVKSRMHYALRALRLSLQEKGVTP